VALIGRQVMWLAALGLERAEIDLFLHASYSNTPLPGELQRIVENAIARNGGSMSTADAIHHFVSLLNRDGSRVQGMEVDLDHRSRRILVYRSGGGNGGGGRW
jgi:hypothetical protein